VWVTLAVPETKGVPLERMQQQLGLRDRPVASRGKAR
jgi:hypothetical protein